MPRLIALFALLLVPFAALLAQDVDEMIYLPADRIEAAVGQALADADEPLVATFLEEREDHTAIMIRRSADGEAESHEVFDDVYVVQHGRGVLLYGGTYEGSRTISEGEYRGGIIRGGMEQQLAPGDVAIVPAGVAHQVRVPEGGLFIYLVGKVRRAR